MTRRIIILGSTGSIGTQSLDVISHVNSLHERGESPVGFEVVGLAAGKNLELLMEQAGRFGVLNISHNGSSQHAESRVTVHPSAEHLVRNVECDIVLAAMVGIAGLPATLAAVGLGRDVALANKETLVAAGGIVIPAAKKSGSGILPIDSEHSGVWQCVGSESACPPNCDVGAVDRVVLTASGGPFRTWARERVDAATPAEALKHPTWSMGKKVTIDSASLMNKALEIIEAHWLFSLPAEKLRALIHPQSLVHSLVEFRDGSIVAQMAPPDMRLPIQLALTHPHRVRGCARRIARQDLSRLEFEEVDPERFPAVSFAYEAIQGGGTAGAILNAANEEAVLAFLRQDAGLPFGWIVRTVREVMRRTTPTPAAEIADILRADASAREVVRSIVAAGTG